MLNDAQMLVLKLDIKCGLTFLSNCSMMKKFKSSRVSNVNMLSRSFCASLWVQSRTVLYLSELNKYCAQ